jgi:hypothetical protein
MLKTLLSIALLLGIAAQPVLAQSQPNSPATVKVTNAKLLTISDMVTLFNTNGDAKHIAMMQDWGFVSMSSVKPRDDKRDSSLIFYQGGSMKGMGGGSQALAVIRRTSLPNNPQKIIFQMTRKSRFYTVWLAKMESDMASLGLTKISSQEVENALQNIYHFDVDGQAFMIEERVSTLPMGGRWYKLSGR